MDVLRRARDTLETCRCRILKEHHDQEDTDGCYRCVRTYHLQYSAERISRERGLHLLSQMIAAGERREQKAALAAIKPDALYGSLLEKKFAEALRAYVEQRRGTWESTIIKGRRGFRFALPGTGRLWELELQPVLGVAQGVIVPSQPDFLLQCDDDDVKPMAIFTDGFEYHCAPTNRLADDIRKRRAILESGNYWVWSVTWDDVTTDASNTPLVCHPKLAQFLQQFASLAQANRQTLPDAQLIVRHGLDQLKAFLETPHASGWKTLAQATAYKPLQLLTPVRTVTFSALQAALQSWRIGHVMPTLSHTAGGDWVYNDKASLNQDVVTYIPVTGGSGNHQAQMVILGRLDDREAQVAGSDFRECWRRFLACMNLYQFCDRFTMWTTSEALSGLAPDLPTAVQATLDEAWARIFEQITTPFRPYIPALSAAGVPVPQVEFYHDQIDDDAFAELAWPQLHPPVALLAGDQVAFASQWQQLGWHVIAADDLHAKGVRWLIEVMTAGATGR